MKEITDFPLYDLQDKSFYKEGKYWIPPVNHFPEVLEGYPRTAQIHDVTLRDGEQTPGVTFTEDERVRIAECLNDIGVARIEAGMPVVSETSAKVCMVRPRRCVSMRITRSVTSAAYWLRRRSWKACRRKNVTN